MNKTAHPDEDGTPVTPPLPDRIAAAINDLTMAQAECTWAEAGTFTLRSEKDDRAKEARDARSKLVAAIAEVVAERDAERARADGLADELAIANDLIASARHDVGERSFLEDAQRILQGCVAPYSCEQMKAVADALRQWRDKWAILLETVVRSNEERDKALADLAAALADRSIRDAEADGRRIERMSADLAAAQAKLAGGIGEVAAEREKQRRKWGSSHDAGHVHDELPRAARDLLDAVLGLGRGDDWGISIRNQGRRDRFVIAAALLVAETDRIAAAEQGGAP